MAPALKIITNVLHFMIVLWIQLTQLDARMDHAERGIVIVQVWLKHVLPRWVFGAQQVNVWGNKKNAFRIQMDVQQTYL